MIINVCLTPEALTDPAPGRPSDATRVRDRLFGFLEAHAFLLFATDDDYDRCLDAVGELPDDEKKLWSELLLRMEYAITGQPPESMSTLEPAARLVEWQEENTRLILVGTEIIRRLGLDAQATVWPMEDLELACADGVPFTVVCRELESLTTVQVNSPEFVGPPHPDDRETIWQQWLKPLVETSEGITIVDPYLGRNLMRQRLHRSFHRKENGISRPREAAWLLGRIAETAQDPKVTILTGVSSKKGRLVTCSRPGCREPTHHGLEVTPDEIAAGLAKCWEKVCEYADLWGFTRLDGLADVEILLETFPWDKRDHPRFIRFSNEGKGIHRYVDFQAGLDRLEYHNLRGRFGGRWALSYFVGELGTNAPASAGNDEIALAKRASARGVRLPSCP